VENDQNLRESLSRRLIQRGFAVTSVCHPRQALEAATITEFRVAVVAQRLPELDGLQLARKLMRLVGDLRVVLLSNQPGEVLAAEAIDCGIFACLHKPHRLVELEGTIELAMVQQPELLAHTI
jgi:DNA-binding NtrC family response regulator